MQRFSVAHAAKKVNTYIHTFFQGIINKNQTYKNNTLKGKYININYHINRQILYNNNNNYYYYYNNS